MKWFKHMSDASSDEFLARLEDDMGLEAIARWWKMLEAIAIQMDKTDRCYAEYPIKKWMVLLSCKQQKILESFVKVLQNFDKISTNYSENILRIECPKLLEFRDEYSRKSGVTPDKVAPDTEERKKKKEVEGEERKKVSKPPTPLKGETAGLFSVDKSIKPDRFEEFWDEYPLKKNKAAALKAYKKAIARASEDAIISGAAMYSEERALDQRPDRNHWTCHASTWLNESRWENYEGQEPAPDPSDLTPEENAARILREAGLV